MTFHHFLLRALINLPRPLKQACAIAMDAALLLAAFSVALWLRFDIFFVAPYYMALAAIASLGGVAALYALGLYRYILRYMSERVILLVAGGVVFSIALVAAVNTFLQPAIGLSRAVLIIYGLLALGSLLGIRELARRLLFPGARQVADTRIPVLIYGAGGAGMQLASALRLGPHYRPVGMIDDDPHKSRLMMAGLRIYPPGRLQKLIDRYQVQQLLIAMPTAPRQRIREIIDMAQQYRLRIRLVPSMKEMVDTQHGLRLRDLKIEDLLGREPVAPLPDLLGQCVTGRVVMVSGGGGSIGSELCRQILSLEPRKLVILEISEPALYLIDQSLAAQARTAGIEVVPVLGSVRDRQLCETVFRRHGVQTIYHAAAYKHVPIVEHNPAEGILTNAYGTLTLAHAAARGGVQDFVLISTDKAVRPTNIMGTSKRLAELILQGLAQTQTGTRFSMVRFGNVLGSSGSVVPLFQRQILAGGPITLTHRDITRFFMTIPEAAQLVLQAGSMGESGSVFVLDMGEPMHILDLAHRMVKLYGLTIRDRDHPDGDIEIQETGLRPGEKLYEELLIGADSTKTEHPRILKAREQSIPYDSLMASLQELETVIAAGDRDAIVARLQRLVPEFQPSGGALSQPARQEPDAGSSAP